MIIEQFVLTAFQQNTRVVACEQTRKAICIDPGEESDWLVRFIQEKDLELQAIGLTHGHLDHVGGAGSLSRSFPDAEILLHKDEEDLYYALRQQPLVIGFQAHQLRALRMDYEEPPPIDRNWKDGEIYGVGTLRFKILHCPGHTRGHVVLVEESERKVFVGDCLFLGTVGRTDLPGGNYEQLIESINHNILSLDDDYTVYSGHGPETTVGHERRTNPFLNGTHRMGSGRFV